MQGNTTGKLLIAAGTLLLIAGLGGIVLRISALDWAFTWRH